MRLKQTRGGVVVERRRKQMAVVGPQLFGMEQMRQDFRSAVDDGVESTVHQRLGAAAIATPTLSSSSGAGGGVPFDFGGALGQMYPSPQDLAQRTKHTWGKKSAITRCQCVSSTGIKYRCQGQVSRTGVKDRHQVQASSTGVKYRCQVQVSRC